MRSMCDLGAQLTVSWNQLHAGICWENPEKKTLAADSSPFVSRSMKGLLMRDAQTGAGNDGKVKR